MKRFLICLSLCLLLSLILTLPAFAAADRLVDEGDLLTDSEEQAVEAELDRISEEWDMDFVIVIPETLGGEDEQVYADDYFDYNGYRYDGALLLLCPWEDARYLSTCGEAIDIIELDAIRDGVLGYYEDGDYYAACMGFAQTCESLLQDNAQSKGGFPVGLLFIALIAGAVLSFLIPMSVLKGQLKSVAPKAAATDYLRKGSMNLRVQRDMFLFRNVSRVAKPKNNSSGTHRSSSGRSHGGGRL